MIRVNEGKTHTCTSCVQAMPDPTPIARSSIVHNTRTTYQYAHLDGNVCKPPAYTLLKGTACYECGDKKGERFDLSPGDRTATPSYRLIYSTRSPSGEYTPAAYRHRHQKERIIGGPRDIHDANTGDRGGVGHGLNAGCAGVGLPSLTRIIHHSHRGHYRRM